MNYELTITFASGNEYTMPIAANSKREAFRMLESQSIEGFYLIKDGGLAIPKSSVKRVEIKEKV